MSGSGSGSGVGTAVNSTVPTTFIEVEEGSKAYEMLIAGKEQRWDDARAFVEGGEDIHSGCYELDVSCISVMLCVCECPLVMTSMCSR